MRRYETIFILRPNLSEEKVEKVVEYFTEIIKNDGGVIIALNQWGMKKLAYLIKKESFGYYVFCDYAGTPASVSEIERRFRIDDTVLKYMTIKTADSIDEKSIHDAISEMKEKAASAEAAVDDGDTKEINTEEDVAEN